MRRVLAAAGADDALETTARGYRLVLESDDLDADVFEDLVHRGQEALGIGEPERAAALLTDALALWRGDILDDLGPPDFAATVIARLTELRVAAEEAAMAAALAMGQHRDVVARLGQLVAAHPFHEQFTGQLMVALYRGGRQADALAAYDQAKRRLAEELGLDPGPDLRTLHTAGAAPRPGAPVDGRGRRPWDGDRSHPLDDPNPGDPAAAGCGIHRPAARGDGRSSGRTLDADRHLASRCGRRSRRPGAERCGRGGQVEACGGLHSPRDRRRRERPDRPL